MVFESIINPPKAEQHPLRVFLLGGFYATIGILLSMWIFWQWSSLVMVFLTVLACLPLFYNTLRYEEKKDKEIHDELKLLKQHFKAILFMVTLFFGFVLAFALWYLVLPEAKVLHAFEAQSATIKSINSATGSAVSFQTFMRIFSNNMRVLFFCIFFSFFYGSGAIFILAWNASVIGTAIGNLARRGLEKLALKAGMLGIGGYFHVISLSLLRYLTHGVFEILGYFVGGLAGGIISVAVIRHDFGSEEFNHIMADALDLLIIGIAILFIGAVIEVYVTPVLFHAAGAHNLFG